MNHLFFFSFIFISWRLITLQYCSGFCHTLTWISHGFTCVSHPDPPSRLPPHPIPVGHPGAPALSTCLMHPTWAGDLFHPWQYTCFSCSLWTSHPCLLPQSPKVCSVHLCLFFYFTYRVMVTIFLNSIIICISVLHWSLSFWLTSLCIMGSSFIHCIRTDSNEFFYVNLLNGEYLSWFRIE